MAEREDPFFWAPTVLVSVMAALFAAGGVASIVKLRRRAEADGDDPPTLGAMVLFGLLFGMLASTLVLAPLIWVVEGAFKLVIRGVKALAGATRAARP